MKNDDLMKDKDSKEENYTIFKNFGEYVTYFLHAPYIFFIDKIY